MSSPMCAKARVEPILQHPVLSLEELDDEQLTAMDPPGHNGQKKRQQWQHRSHADSLPKRQFEYSNTTGSISPIAAASAL